jgi:hypothetical protein
MKNQSVAGSHRFAALLLCISLLFVACLALVAHVNSEQAASAPPQKASTEQTVEQVQKNIKVISGLPVSQLFPVMNFISASLGVRCQYCHVNKDGKWDFPSDEKPEKATAREMIKMVLSVNKSTFKGDTEVSCFTCHRGRTNPASVPQLPIPEVTPRPVTEVTPTETLPTVDQIFAKYTEAIGGAAAIDKLKSRAMKGTWLTSNGISLGYEVYQVGPDRLYSILNTPKQGVFERGFDGSIAWEKSGRGIRDIEGSELFYLRRYPDLFKDIKLKEQFTRTGVAGKDKIGDREVFVVRGVTVDKRLERLYFDTQTGLLLRRVSNIPTMIAIIPEQIDFEDYRDVDGMKMPFTIRISAIDPFYTSTRSFAEIKINVPVDETKFRKPVAMPSPSPSPVAEP